MRVFVVLALAAAALAEPEADPALVYTSGLHAPLTYGGIGSVYSTPLTTPVVQTPVTYSAGPDGIHTPVVYSTGVQTPVVYSTGLQTPVVYSTGVQTPVVYSTGLQRPVVYSAGVASTHTITNYHNPNHYTAVSNGAVGPKYIAKNGPVAHVVKREAEAEAEADPWYTTYSGMIPSYPTSVYPRYPVYPTVNSVPTVNTVVPTINRVVPTINRVVPTINRVVPTVNTVFPTVNTVVPTVNRVVPAINRIVPTVNRIVPTINRIVPTINRVVPTINGFIPTVNTVNTLRNLPIADTFEHDTKNPFLIADDFGLGTKKTETDAGDVVVA